MPTKTREAVRAGEPTTSPPPRVVVQTGLPVAASTAQTFPVQSPKNAVPPATTGVPVTPTSPSRAHDWARLPTESASISVSAGLKRLLERSRPYIVHPAGAVPTPDPAGVELEL